MEIVKVAILGIVGTLLAVQMKYQKSEYAIYITFGIAFLIFFMVIEKLILIVDSLTAMQTYLSGTGSYFVLLLKIIGVTYLCEFACGICKDAGFTSVASQIQIFGKITVLVTGLPIVMCLLEMITGLEL